MKYIISLITFVYALSLNAQTNKTLVPFLKKNGKYIYVDSASMKQVIKGEYDKVTFFNNDRAIVGNKKKEGIINSKGQEITPLIYDELSHNELSTFIIANLNGKYGIIDVNGKKLVEFKYSELSTLRNDTLIAKINDNYGLIKTNGEIILPFDYELILNSSYGFHLNDILIIRQKGKSGLIRTNGKIVKESIYDYISSYNLKFANITLNGKSGIIDLEGNEAIPFIQGQFIGRPNAKGYIIAMLQDEKYCLINQKGITENTIFYDMIDEYINSKEDNLYLVRKDGKYGYINEEGYEIFEPKFNYASPFVDGIAVNSVDYSDYYFVDKNGDVLFDKSFELAYPFMNDVAVVKYKKKYCLINKAGEIIMKSNYELTETIFKELILAKLGNKYGLLNKNGKPVTGFKYNSIRYVGDDNYLIVELNKKYGLIDSKGKEITPCKYDYIDLTTNNPCNSYLIVTSNKQSGIINKLGKEITACKYKSIYSLFESNFIRVTNKNQKTYYLDCSGREYLEK